MVNTFEKIKELCLKSEEKDPIKLAVSIMKEDYIHMHGPEHHVLDGACFLTAMHNAGVEFDLDGALDELINRGSKMPGATCGNWGMCGSAASVGAALAIIHGTGPLSNNEYYKDNLKLVSQALGKIAEIGGPRCCKRNAFLSIQTAIDFANETYKTQIPKSEIVCEFSGMNQQCKGLTCPFFGGR